MRVVVQRVKQASVSVEGAITGKTGVGLQVLAGFEADDQPADLDWMAQKLVKLRVFPDEQGVMNRSVADIGGEVLAVSQFTLYASTKKGNRPSWGRPPRGLPSGRARRATSRNPCSQPLSNVFPRRWAGRVPTGVFGADMQMSSSMTAR